MFVRLVLVACVVLSASSSLHGDKKAMIKEQDRLNKASKPKRDRSFHADQPRRAAVHAKKMLTGATKVVSIKESVVGSGIGQKDSTKGIKGKEASPPGAGSSSKKFPQVQSSGDEKETKASLAKGKPTPLGALLNSVYTDESSDDEAVPSKKNTNLVMSDDDDCLDKTVPVSSSTSSESDIELTPAEEALLKKIRRKNQKRDRSALSEIINSNQKKIKVEQKKVDDEEGHSNGKVKPQDSKVLKEEKELEKERDEEPKKVQKKTAEDENSKIDKAENPATKKVDSSGMSKNKLSFDDEFFNTHEDSPNAVELAPNSKIYITAKQLKDVKRRCNTPTATARMLLNFVFTERALELCSVGGVARVNRTTKEVSQRPALHADGVEAIVEFVTVRSTKKGWTCPPDSAIRQSLNNKLCEQRADKKARLEQRSKGAE